MVTSEELQKHTAQVEESAPGTTITSALHKSFWNRGKNTALRAPI